MPASNSQCLNLCGFDASKKVALSSLPAEILLMFIRLLSPRDIRSLSLCSKRWRIFTLPSVYCHITLYFSSKSLNNFQSLIASSHGQHIRHITYVAPFLTKPKTSVNSIFPHPRTLWSQCPSYLHLTEQHQAQLSAGIEVALQKAALSFPSIDSFSMRLELLYIPFCRRFDTDILFSESIAQHLRSVLPMLSSRNPPFGELDLDVFLSDNTKIDSVDPYDTIFQGLENIFNQTKTLRLRGQSRFWEPILDRVSLRSVTLLELNDCTFTFRALIDFLNRIKQRPMTVKLDAVHVLSIVNLGSEKILGSPSEVHRKLHLDLQQVLMSKNQKEEYVSL
ncbi:F-box protein [Aspergillus tanneri]|uniref:F-box domain-containing protein n=1 Tax=Aspergillus tanneri TaxID=1220188 RepID=A0A5M9M9K1_9EURO|nr:uncharacterized protein ATNIH1004_011729 [Aspergillus tanneri]KAA8641593.1 hypothetical protein ATNIH1004_011729 [Aspergillus tanneri]